MLKPESYDITSAEGRAQVTSILPKVKDGLYAGPGFGDPKSIVYFSGSQKELSGNTEASFENVNSINFISGTGEICVCGKITADHGGALRIRESVREVVKFFGVPGVKLLETISAMAVILLLTGSGCSEKFILMISSTIVR